MVKNYSYCLIVHKFSAAYQKMQRYETVCSTIKDNELNVYVYFPILCLIFDIDKKQQSCMEEENVHINI